LSSDRHQQLLENYLCTRGISAKVLSAGNEQVHLRVLQSFLRVRGTIRDRRCADTGAEQQQSTWHVRVTIPGRRCVCVAEQQQSTYAATRDGVHSHPQC
jgi:hypothetical protein